MIADPQKEILTLLALVAGYAALGWICWMIFFRPSRIAVARLNAAIRAQGVSPLAGAAPDLEITLRTLVARRQLSDQLASRVRRAAPVFHRGRWVVYPSNAYWAHRFEHLDSGGARRV